MTCPALVFLLSRSRLVDAWACSVIVEPEIFMIADEQDRHGINRRHDHRDGMVTGAVDANLGLNADRQAPKT